MTANWIELFYYANPRYILWNLLGLQVEEYLEGDISLYGQEGIAPKGLFQVSQIFTPCKSGNHESHAFSLLICTKLEMILRVAADIFLGFDLKKRTGSGNLIV